MTKKPKSMTIILIIIAVIVLVYVVAWVRVGFIAGVVELGCKKTYTPKYGLPFVWVVHVTPDPKFPKLSSGCESDYEINVFTASKITGSAVKKICSAKQYEIVITEYSNKNGQVGGYLETPHPEAGITDPPTLLYDKEGSQIGLGTLLNNEKQRENFTTKFSEMRKNFPNEKTFSCPKK